MEQFRFLAAEQPFFAGYATSAEQAVRSDPRMALFYARCLLEQFLKWLYRADSRLKEPYKGKLDTLILDPSFRRIAGQAIYDKASYIRKVGNQAVYDPCPVAEMTVQVAVSELFHVAAFWLARNYARKNRPSDGIQFDPARLPPPSTQIVQRSLEEIKKLQAQLEASLQEKLLVKDEELKHLREEIAWAREVNQAIPDHHDYNEAGTLSVSY